MAYTTIDKPTDYFLANLHTGTGSSQNITTGLDMSTNGGLVWNKVRSTTNNHVFCDSVRGATKLIFSDLTLAEQTDATSVTSFNSDGWTGGGGGNTNGSSQTFVSWNWLAGGTASSNTDGSITSSVSANTTAGFSIVSYTGNLTDGATVGHGLGVTPSCIIFKNRSDVQYWVVYHKDLGGGNNHLRLDSTTATTTSLNMFSSTAPTSSVFELGNKEQVNGNTNNIIAYCFAEKKGYSKFGSYTGNGNADGAFVYTGFKPAFIIIKYTGGTANWIMWDNKRNTFNVTNLLLKPNLNNAENTSTGNALDFTSNGFKCRGTDSATNVSGGSYIYMAFAENPFVTSTGIPTTAR